MNDGHHLISASRRGCNSRTRHPFTQASSCIFSNFKLYPLQKNQKMAIVCVFGCVTLSHFGATFYFVKQKEREKEETERYIFRHDWPSPFKRACGVGLEHYAFSYDTTPLFIHTTGLTYKK